MRGYMRGARGVRGRSLADWWAPAAVNGERGFVCAFPWRHLGGLEYIHRPPGKKWSISIIRTTAILYFSWSVWSFLYSYKATELVMMMYPPSVISDHLIYI